MRSLTLLKPNENTDEVPICLLVNRASHLCHDLNNEENLLDDEFAIEQPDVVHSARIFKKRPLIRHLFVEAPEQYLKNHTLDMEGLRGMSWNSEGFRDPGKHLFFDEAIREYSLDFIALLETGRSNFSNAFITSLSGDVDFAWFCLPQMCRSGGIWLVLIHLLFKLKSGQWGFLC
jgi:hypothetical protein